MGCKLERWRWRHNFPKLRHRKIFLTLFYCSWQCFSRLHVNIITDSGVTTISFHKGLTRNLEIENTILWVLPNICRLGKFRNTKCNKMLLNASKCQGYIFYRFWVIKGKPTGRGGKFTPLPPRIGLTETQQKYLYYIWKIW